MYWRKNKKAFTLVEMLVVVSIVGIISSFISAGMRGGINKAKGANTVTALNAIEDAFVIKALDDNITEWWHEEDFPSTNSWAAYIEDLVNDEIINTFLPVAPDYPNPDPSGSNLFEYAYDQDDDVFNNLDGAACFDYTESFTGNWGQWNNLRGVNIVIQPGTHPDSDEFRETFAYLDSAIDGSDGPYCGKMRHDAWDVGNPSHNSARHQYYRYAIDFDLQPNH